MIVPETLHQQSDLDEEDLDDIDEYRFFGIIQRPGEVCPVNIDHCLYYTPLSVQEAPSVVGLPIRIDHIDFPDAPGVSQIGEIVDERLFENNIFGLHELRRDDWDSFVEFVEEGNGNINLSFNQLVREIHAGHLALSAGLDVGTSQTPIHDFTVLEIVGWDEVSVVGAPASPGSWAWACEGSCDIVFGEQMSTKQLDVDLETLQQSTDDGDSDGGMPSQIVDVLESDQSHGVQITPDGEVYAIEDEDDVVQSNCQCDDYEEQIEQLKEERDQYKSLVEEIEQERREGAAQRLRDVNEDIPEEEQYEEDELDDFIEESSVQHLEQTADMLERVADSTPEQGPESGKEDLGGTSGSPSDDEIEEAKQQVDDITNDLFGKDSDTVFQEIEEGTFGN